jgi:hypothetical protein
MQNSAFTRLIILTALLIAAALLFSQAKTVPVPNNSVSTSPRPTITLPPLNIPRHSEEND